MKKQINPTIKAHLVRGAFYLLLLLAVCAIPFALAQRNTTKRGLYNPNTAAKSAAVSKQDAADTSLRPYDARVPAGARAKAFGLSTSKLANALLGHTGLEKNASVIGNNPLLTYMIDDGTAEDSIGLTAGGSFIACNSFPVTAGNNIITSISIAWGTPAFPDPTLDGLAYTAVLWSDPNGDGSPTDAVVLAMAPGVISQQGTNTFITSNITPTMVTTPNFFVGFLITHIAGQFPAAFDEDAPTLPNRSWITTSGNINDLSGAFPIESVGLVGNWLIRAEGEGGGTPSPTPTSTPNSCATYNTTTGTGTITPGDTDTGNHCDDCATVITFPFPVSVYGQTFNSANVSSNGSLDLIGTQSPFTHGCQVLPSSLWTMAILPYQDDLRTDQFSGCSGFPGATCGIFTSTTGTAPNRQFNIEWRAVHFADTTTSANFSVVFYENDTTLFDVIYGATSDNGLDETSGVQASVSGPATTFSCGTATLTDGLKVTYSCQGASSPTPTPTASPTGTPSGCVINGSLDSGDPTQIDRLFRSGIPQTCPASTTCAIFGDPTPRHYDAYTFTNTTGATQCVTVDTNTACTGTNFIFVAAYLGSFDPNNLCTNWIGDSGGSPNPDQPFSFNVDNGQTFVIVVSEVTPNAGCPAYMVTVSPSSICGGGVSPTPTATATATATVTASATPTATATETPRSTPTPRPRPTPAPRPSP